MGEMCRRVTRRVSPGENQRWASMQFWRVRVKRAGRDCDAPEQQLQSTLLTLPVTAFSDTLSLGFRSTF